MGVTGYLVHDYISKIKNKELVSNIISIDKKIGKSTSMFYRLTYFRNIIQSDTSTQIEKVGAGMLLCNYFENLLDRLFFENDIEFIKTSGINKKVNKLRNEKIIDNKLDLKLCKKIGNIRNRIAHDSDNFPQKEELNFLCDSIDSFFRKYDKAYKCA